MVTVALALMETAHLKRGQVNEITPSASRFRRATTPEMKVMMLLAGKEGFEPPLSSLTGTRFTP